MPIINTVYPQTGTNTSDATATAAQILSPYTAYVASGKVTGTMPPFSDQTSATATSNDILQGKTAWVNGQKITGTLNVGTQAIQLTNGQILFDGTTLSITQPIFGPIWTGRFRYMENVSGSPYLRVICFYVNADESFGSIGSNYLLSSGNSSTMQDISVQYDSVTKNGITCIENLKLLTSLEVSSFYPSDQLSGVWVIGVQPNT